MVERKRRTKKTEQPAEEENQEEAVGNYFTRRSTSIQFIPTGCTLLDCVVGGGWPLGRISNIVGDKSTGKTLIAIEAAANFAQKFPDGDICYAEAEAAFDKGYAESLGLPVDKVEFPEEIYTVEDVFEHLSDKLQDRDKDKPGLYIIDSLDALSDRAERERGIDEGTYGAAKAKKMSELFRRRVSEIEKNNVHVMFISQIRDRMNPGFGKKYTRSGGRALDFYASQIIMLAHMKTLTRTRKGIERANGVQIKAKCEKNKITMPFRECEFEVAFGYGINDLAANLNWLVSTKNIDAVGLSQDEAKKKARRSLDLPEDEFMELSAEAKEAVERIWYEAEEDFIPKRRKY